MNPWKIVGPVVIVALTLLPAPAHAQRRGGGRSPGGGGGSRPAVSRAVPSRSVGSRAVVGAPYGRSFSRPYYAFRPRVSVGFGLYVGYPVAFPYYGYAYGGYAYGNPYGYGYAYPYGPYPSYSTYPYPYAYSGSVYPYPDYRPSVYPPATNPNYPPQTPPAQSAQGSIGVAPGTPQQGSGGISFSITPDNAQVYVEGQYVGLVSTFSPTSQPLTLAPGRHHVEIRLVGYQTMTFDTEITPNQVTPYQGTMQR